MDQGLIRFIAIDDNDSINHHGVLGMKWGVRRYQNKDGTLTPLGKRRIQKEANKDAKEYASAKMYYGEGAGTRRKLIKATVESKKKDKYYSDAFDKALENQDMAKRAAEARTKRKVEDVKNTTVKTTRGLINQAAGTGRKASAAAIAIFSAYSTLHMTGIDKKIINKGKDIIYKVLSKRR